MWRSGRYESACGAVRGCAQIVAHSTNGTRARRAPAYAAGSATRPERPATTARKRPDAASRSTPRWLRPQHGNGRSPPPGAAAMADVAPDQREHDVLALVQGGERADPERRRVVGDEQDRAAHRRSRSALVPRLRPSARAT